MTSSFTTAARDYNKYSAEVDRQTENYKNNLIGKDTNKTLSEDDVHIIDTLTSDIVPHYIDPIKCSEEIDKLNEIATNIVSEINSAIKISNATTVITIE
jgi:hypothetical protein